MEVSSSFQPKLIFLCRVWQNTMSHRKLLKLSEAKVIEVDELVKVKILNRLEERGGREGIQGDPRVDPAQGR